jgi:hypothetical protein
MSLVRRRRTVAPLMLVIASAATIPALGESVRLPAVRDTWFSEVGREADGNNGRAPRLKVKSYQEMSVVDFDTKPLRGRVVTGATLHLRLAGDQPLHRLTVGSFGAPWVEGTSTNYRPEPGASTFRSRKHPDTP